MPNPPLYVLCTPINSEDKIRVIGKPNFATRLSIIRLSDESIR